jgi:hypothetical protein
VHTFGIGSGASTELIKNCAKAGHGHYTFINDLNEIEKKVMESLQKDFLEYITIKSATLLNMYMDTVATLPEGMDLC